MPQEISGKETGLVWDTAEKLLKVVEADGTLGTSTREGDGILHGENLTAKFERMITMQNRDVIQDLQDSIRTNELIAARSHLITGQILKGDCGESKERFVRLTGVEVVR